MFTYTLAIFMEKFNVSYKFTPNPFYFVERGGVRVVPEYRVYPEPKIFSTNTEI